MKLYTKTGDTGDTTCNGERVRKNNPIILFIGDMDELNSHIGMLVSIINDDIYKESLIRIQNILFDICGYIAYPSKVGGDLFHSFLEKEIIWLESAIDAIELPPLTSFILPNGGTISSQSHICRSVCRRAERSLYNIDVKCKYILQFMNRLSDYLFTFARKFSEYNIIYKSWMKR